MAIITGHPALTFAVFIGVYVATKMEQHVGAADGKLMIGLAALAASLMIANCVFGWVLPQASRFLDDLPSNTQLPCCTFGRKAFAIGLSICEIKQFFRVDFRGIK